MIRLLFTGSREVSDRAEVVRALSTTLGRIQRGRPVVLVHGAARGADTLAAQAWADWHRCWPDLYLPAESHPARQHPDPKARNLHMVSLGAEECVALARDYASGTGHCAREARKAGIPVTDYGVRTATGADVISALRRNADRHTTREKAA